MIIPSAPVLRVEDVPPTMTMECTGLITVIGMQQPDGTVTRAIRVVDPPIVDGNTGQVIKQGSWGVIIPIADPILAMKIGQALMPSGEVEIVGPDGEHVET